MQTQLAPNAPWPLTHIRKAEPVSTKRTRSIQRTQRPLSSPNKPPSQQEANKQKILLTLSRGPATIKQLQAITGLGKVAIYSRIKKLIAAEVVVRVAVAKRAKDNTVQSSFKLKELT